MLTVSRCYIPRLCVTTTEDTYNKTYHIVSFPYYLLSRLFNVAVVAYMTVNELTLLWNSSESFMNQSTELNELLICYAMQHEEGNM